MRRMQVYDLDLAGRGTELPLAGSTAVAERFCRLAWGSVNADPAGPAVRPAVLPAAASVTHRHWPSLLLAGDYGCGRAPPLQSVAALSAQFAAGPAVRHFLSALRGRHMQLVL